MRILLVDDDEADRLCFERILKEQRPDIDLVFAQNGSDALDLLMTAEGALRAPAPDLVILDLNMPQLDGFETLAAIKSTNATAHLKVAVLTTSMQRDDARRAIAIGADSFFIKPQTVAGYSFMMSRLIHLLTKNAGLLSVPSTERASDPKKA